MLVREWMTEEPQTVTVTTPVMDAMQRMRQGGFRRLPVVHGGRLVGIVTDRDLKEATPSKVASLSVYELNYLLSKLLVRDVMSSAVITAAPEDPIERAALLMEEHAVSGLPIVEDGSIVGMLTITDLLRAFVGFLGLREGGVRVTVDLPDEPGALAKVAEAGPPSNIVAVVTAGVVEGERRRLVLRAGGAESSAFPERLERLGIDVRDVR